MKYNKIFRKQISKKYKIEYKKGGSSSSERRTKAANIAARQVAIGRIKAKSKKRSQVRGLGQKTLVTELKKGAKTYKSSLEKIDFKGTLLDNVTLSNKPLENLDLTKIIIKNSRLLNTKFTNSNLTESIFDNNDMISTQFKNANLTSAKFKNIKNLKDANFDNVKLDNVEFNNVDNTPILFILQHANSNNTNKLNNIKIINCKTPRVNVSPESSSLSDKILIRPIILDSIFLAPKFSKIIFDHGEIKNTRFEKFTNQNIVITECNFLNSIIHNSTFIKTRISDCIFKNCTIKNNKFNDAIFLNCEMHNLTGTDGSLKNNNFNYSQILNVTFKNSNLENSTFNGSRLDVEFNNANLNGCQFVPVLLQLHDGRQRIMPTVFHNMSTFNGASIAGATFQQTIGLENKNFNNINLVGTSFAGCSLLNTSFRNADLRNATFNMCAITGCDFTGSRIDGINVSPDTLATGDANNGLNNRLRPTDHPKIYPTDIHAAFGIVNLNKLYREIYVTSLENYSNSQTLDYLKDNIKDIISNFKSTIDDERGRKEVEEKKSKVMKFWEKCYKERLNTYDFNSYIKNTNPSLKWNSLLLTIINFVKKQNIEFKETYVTEVIVESATTYGEDGLSCPAGIVERFVIKLKAAIELTKPILEQNKNYDKLIEYNKILNILDPTQESPTTREEIKKLIETSPVDEEQTYFEVTQPMRDEWREFHKTGGPNQFQHDDTINIKLEMYKDFLREKFYFDNKSKKQKEILNDVIKKELEGMAAVLEFDDEFFDPGDGAQNGGRRKNHSIFSDKKLFHKLCKKYCLCNKRKYKTKKINKKINKKTKKNKKK